MKKRIISCFTALALILSMSVMFCSCSSAPKAPEGTVTRITIDVNPSVELMVDDENKVVAVTALNDDGSILIAGETIVGKDAEDAAELIVSLSADTGYIVKGEVSADENTVKISVSGNSEYAEHLKNTIEQNTAEFMEKHDINGKVEKIEAAKMDTLRQIAAGTSGFTAEELETMSENDLYKVIAAGRIETALLLTQDLREAYNTAKEYEISFAERKATAAVIEGMGNIYTLVHAGYKTALEAYSSAIKAIDDFRYETLVSPDSEYQESLAKLREAKTELLKQKNYVATLDINGEEYASASLTLTMKEETYEAALSAYEKLGEIANSTLESLISTMRSCEQALISLEENFSDDIKAELTAHAKDLENAVNEAKDGFFAEFEAAHKDDIEAIEADLIARKQELIASAENS